MIKKNKLTSTLRITMLYVLFGLIFISGCQEKTTEQIREEAYLSGGEIWDINITENPIRLNCLFDFPDGDVSYLLSIDGKEQEINATCEYGIKMNCKYIIDIHMTGKVVDDIYDLSGEVMPSDTTKIYDCKPIEPKSQVEQDTDNPNG